MEFCCRHMALCIENLPKIGPFGSGRVLLARPLLGELSEEMAHVFDPENIVDGRVGGAHRFGRVGRNC